MAARKRLDNPTPDPVSKAVLPSHRAHRIPAKRPGAKFLFAAAVVLVLTTQWIDGTNRLRVIEKATRMDLAAGQNISVAGEFRGDDQILPTSGIDGKWWVLHTEKMLRDGGWRVRETRIDNSPDGREVHWSSPLLWLLAGLSRVLATFSGGNATNHVATAAIYAGPLLFLIGLAVFAALVVWRYGWNAGTCAILVIGTSSPILQFFRLGDCDHHGLVSLGALIGVFCLAAGGAGYQAIRGHEDRRARAWFIGGGVASAAALWISAATEIPVLAGTAVAVLATAFLNRRQDGIKPAAPLWRLWGLSGGITSLVLYAAEYFPNHLGWRLEVNHPLYALAWMGGGYLLACAVTGIHDAPRFRFSRWELGPALLCLILVIAPALAISLFPDRVFWVSDRFLLELHNRHIVEFQPLLSVLADGDWILPLLQALCWPVLAGVSLAWLHFSGRVPALWRAPLLLAVSPSLVMLGLAFRQVRWLGVAVMLWAGVATLLGALWFNTDLHRTVPRLAARGLAIATILLIGMYPVLATTSWISSRARPDALPRNIIPNVVARDIVRRIMTAEPGRRPVILCAPTTSTELAFYGNVGVIGTLYWENMAGLKAAAELFSETDEATLKQSLLQRGVTHILLFSWDDFASGYEQLIADTRTDAAPVPGLISKLLGGEATPDWIRPLFYPLPAEFGLGDAKVWLFEIRDGQSRFDALLHRGVFAFDAGNFREARELFIQAGAKQPGDARIPELIRLCDDQQTTLPPRDSQRNSTQP